MMHESLIQSYSERVELVESFPWSCSSALHAHCPQHMDTLPDIKHLLFSFHLSTIILAFVSGLSHEAFQCFQSANKGTMFSFSGLYSALCLLQASITFSSRLYHRFKNY